MASAAEILVVRQNLGAESLSNPAITDKTISDRLDAGESAAVIAASWWRQRVAATAGFVSISESGSTRDMGSVYKNAVAMMEYWDKQVAKEEAVANGELPKRVGTRIGRITRV